MGEPDLAQRGSAPDAAWQTAHVFTIDGHVRFWAEQRPRAIAIDTGDQTIDFATLDADTARIAQGLADWGLFPGDRIAWIGAGHPALFMRMFHAAARAGMVTVPIDPALDPETVAAILADAAPRLVIADSGDAIPGQRRLDPAAALAWCDALPPPPPDAPVFAAPNAPVLQLYPADPARGVMLSHCNLLGLRKTILGHDLPDAVPRDDEAMLVVLPFWRIEGLGPLLLALAAGLPAIMRNPAHPASCIAAACAHRALRVYAAPDAAAAMLAHAEAHCIGRDRIRLLHVGPHPITPALKRGARLHWGARVVAGWGRAETAGTIAILADGVARPLPGVELRVVDAAGCVLPPGSAGQIEIRAVSCMLGYTNASAPHRGDGWMGFGDAGVLDADGALRPVQAAERTPLRPARFAS